MLHVQQHAQRRIYDALLPAARAHSDTMDGFFKTSPDDRFRAAELFDGEATPLHPLCRSGGGCHSCSKARLNTEKGPKSKGLIPFAMRLT